MLQFRTVGKDERMYHMGKFEKKMSFQQQCGRIGIVGGGFVREMCVQGGRDVTLIIIYPLYPRASLCANPTPP